MTWYIIMPGDGYKIYFAIVYVGNERSNRLFDIDTRKPRYKVSQLPYGRERFGDRISATISMNIFRIKLKDLKYNDTLLFFLNVSVLNDKIGLTSAAEKKQDITISKISGK